MLFLAPGHFFRVVVDPVVSIELAVVGELAADENHATGIALDNIPAIALVPEPTWHGAAQRAGAGLQLRFAS